MDPIWLLVALAGGFVARQLHLPPLVGFLVAGFVLHALGEQGGEMLQAISDFGVSLLLFTIGLKLRPVDLVATEVWATALVHMLLFGLVCAGLVVLAGFSGLSQFAGLDPAAAALVGFALSFSSTVFAVKILEDRGELKTRHGQVAIGILIIQDLVAVGFIMATHQSLPSPWALALFGLLLLRPLLRQLLQQSGHGELLVLFGIVLAIGGGALFELTGLKSGLGALVFGMLLSTYPRSAELSGALMSHKDLFLIGFFLSIGISGLPDLATILTITVLVIVLLPVKMALFIWLMTRFRLRLRAAFLAMLSLASFSEFGLIVVAEASGAGWLGAEWLVNIAIALSISFIVAALLNAKVHALFPRIESRLESLESPDFLPGDEVAGCGDARILVVGLGRVGRGAYHAMRETHGDVVLGVDADRQRIDRLTNLGYRVITGDAEALDFWKRMMAGRVEMILLALPKNQDALVAVSLLRKLDYQGMIGAVAKHEDERAELEAAGIQAAFNYYAEVGKGFANHVNQMAERTGPGGQPV